MKKYIATLGIIVFTVLAFIIGFSCKKKPSELGPGDGSYTGNTSNVDAFFTSNVTPPLTFTINSALPQSITGTGALVIIPANAFVVKATNAPVTGTVQITMKEIYTKKDMILNKAQTMTSSDILSSAGELNIKAMQGTNELKLAAGKQLSIKIKEPLSPQSGMQLFYGSINNDEQLIWSTPSTTVNIPPTWDSTAAFGGGYYYNFNCDSLNWINCDVFYYNSNPKTSFTVTVSGNHNKSNTTMFVAFTNINGIAGLYGGNTTPQVFSNVYQVPVGINATIIAISEINGQYYSAFLPTTITTGFSAALTLTATTNSAILTQLNSL